MNEQIENLALSKGFAQLNAAERKIVLEYMTADSYQDLRKMLLAIHHLDAEHEPPTALRQRLLVEMAKQKQPNAFMHWATTPIPIWAVAAIALTIGLAVWQIRKPTPLPVPPPPIVETIIQRDTLWLEKTVWKEKVIWKTRYLPSPSESLAQIDATVDSSAVQSCHIWPEEVFPAVKIGTPMSEMSAWLEAFSNAGK